MTRPGPDSAAQGSDGPAVENFRLTGPFTVGMIWAQTPAGVIGRGGDLAWHLPEDLAHFRRTTRGYAVLHGRKSYEALPQRYRPLPGRRNIVLTREGDYDAPGAEVVHSLTEAARRLAGEPVWIVGGGAVYRTAMDGADVLVVTEVDTTAAGDTYAPQVDPSMWQVAQRTAWATSRTGTRFRVVEYRRR